MLKRARFAAAALFLTNGALFANLLPRFPEIKTDLAMSNAAYGAAVASFSGGALLAGGGREGEARAEFLAHTCLEPLREADRILGARITRQALREGVVSA